MRGGAVERDGRSAIVWGEGVYRVHLRTARVERLAVGSFRQAGCVTAKGLVLESGGNLVWLAGPKYDSISVIDTDAEIADCLEASLLGRHGILVTWRGMQVRHYFPAAPGAARWPYREVYSFYTASYQAGLLLGDVDGDGRPDVVCGNYWIQSPEAYGLPWRLHAIHTWNEEPMSARVKLDWLRPGVLGVWQRAMIPARVAVFQQPAGATQLWKEDRRESDVPLVWRGLDPVAVGAACIEAWNLRDAIACLEPTRLVLSPPPPNKNRAGAPRRDARPLRVE